MSTSLKLLVLFVISMTASAEVTQTSMSAPNSDFAISEDTIMAIPADYSLSSAKVSEVLDYNCLASDNVEAKCDYQVTWTSMFCAKGVSTLAVNINFLADGLETSLAKEDSQCLVEKYTTLK